MSRGMPLIYCTVFDRAGNSQRVTEETHRVKGLSYTDSEKKADKCVLTVENFDLANFDDPIWAQGNLVQISWGYPGMMAIPRTALITKVTGFTELKVEAKALSVVMDTEKKSRTFKGMTRSQIVLKIAREYGYTDDTLLVEDSGAKFPHVTQANITDAQLIRKLAHQQGFEFYVDYEGFHFHEMKLVQEPLRSFIYYTDPGRGDIMSISVESDVTRRVTEVKKTARNPITKETTTTQASNDTDDREGTGETLIIASSDLRTASFQSTDTRVPEAGMSTSNLPLTQYTPAEMALRQSVYVPVDAGPLMSSPEGGSAAAAAETKAKFRKAQRGAVKMAISAIGDPSMLAKSLITIMGVGKRLSGAYHVQEVTHDVTGGGYTMKLKVLSDGAGSLEGRTQARTENGLPQVAGVASKSKRIDPSLKNKSEAAILLGAQNQSVDNAALIAAPIHDKAGNVIGTAWREKPAGYKTPPPAKTPTTTITPEGVLSTEGT